MGELNLDNIERALPRVEEISGDRSYGAAAEKKRPQESAHPRKTWPAHLGKTIMPACPR